MKVDIDGNVLPPSRYGINPAGFTIHSAIHHARPDVKVAMHLHTDQALRCRPRSAAFCRSPRLAMNVMKDVTYHDYEGIALDADEKERLVGIWVRTI